MSEKGAIKMNKPFDYNSDNQIFVRNRICQQFPQQIGKNGYDRRSECANDCMACQAGGELSQH